MKFDGIIFDIDGILVDVSKSYREAIRLTAGYFLKQEVSKSEVNKIKNVVGMNNDWDATYTLIGNPKISYSAVKSYFQSIYLGTSKKKGLINNEKLLVTKADLTLLKRKYKKIGIATGRPREEAKYVINKNRLEGIFQCIVTMEDVQKGKPSPDMILMVIKKINLKNTVYIGDSPGDVIASQAAGISCIYVGKQNIGTVKFKTVSQVVNYLL